MDVSVIIPTYNENRDIGNCLESLRKQPHKNFEVIVVDDGSTDNTLDIVRKFRNVKVLKQNHKGPGAARNLGAKAAKGKILIFIDADMTFDKDYLKNLIRPLIEDKKGETIGTTHDYEEAKNTDNIWSNLWGKIRVSKENAKDVKIFRAIRKDKFLELGGFDPKYGYADDQTFWFKYRIKPIVAENTTCYHKNPETLRGTFKQAIWIGASWKERFWIFRIPLINFLAVFITFIALPLLIFAKSAKTGFGGKFSFKDLIKFYSAKFCGYAVGVFRAVFFKKTYR